MRRPDHNYILRSLYQLLDPARIPEAPVDKLTGKVVAVGPTVLRAALPGVSMGELCCIHPGKTEAEVVGIEGNYAVLSPFSSPEGITTRSVVVPTGSSHMISVGDALVGRILDGMGRPLDGLPPDKTSEKRGLDADAPNPLTRRIIDTPLPLGVRAIDGLLTCGVGQRVGIFAAAGGGKSTLLSMICDGNLADVIVLALIGERGREVREFLENTLSAEARARSVIIIATSDRPALERLKAAYTATTVAEYFRDQGKNVLLMMDSLTRFARAVREVGLASGEPPAAGGYPPSFFARLPRLLERAGPAETGSITGLYTVLVEGDNLNETVSDEVRSILDGHIVLSRKLAQANHYPAIDISASVSRIMGQIAPESHQKSAGKMRKLMASWKEIELLVRVGEYQQGNDPVADEALLKKSAIQDFLCQSVSEKSAYESTIRQLCQTVT